MANGFQEDLGAGVGTSVTPSQAPIDRSTATLIQGLDTGVKIGLEVRDQSILAEVDEENQRLEASVQQGTQSAATVRTRAEAFARTQAARAPHLAGKINASLGRYLSTSSSITQAEAFDKVQTEAAKKADPTGAIALTATSKEDYINKATEHAIRQQQNTKDATSNEEFYMGRVRSSLESLFKATDVANNPAAAQKMAVEYSASDRGALVSDMIADGMDKGSMDAILGVYDQGISGYANVMSGISKAAADQVSAASSKVKMDTMEYYGELLPLKELVGDQAFGQILQGFALNTLVKSSSTSSDTLASQFEQSVATRFKAQTDMNNAKAILSGEQNAAQTGASDRTGAISSTYNISDGLSVTSESASVYLNGLTYLNDSASTPADSLNWMNGFDNTRRAKLLSLSQIHPDKDAIKVEADKLGRHAEQAIARLIGDIGNGSSLTTFTTNPQDALSVKFDGTKFALSNEAGEAITQSTSSLAGAASTRALAPMMKQIAQMNNAFANLKTSHTISKQGISPEDIARSLTGGRLDEPTNTVREYDPATGTFRSVK